MAINGTNQELIKEILLEVRAEFQVSNDWVQKPTIISSVGGNRKQTLLVGSPAVNGKAKWPSLSLVVWLGQRSDAPLSKSIEFVFSKNFLVNELEGEEIEIELNNYFFRTPPKPPIVYKAKLSSMIARVNLSSEDVGNIFKRDGALNARVNENLLEFKVTIRALELAASSLNRLIVYRRKRIVFVPGLLGSTLSIKTPDGPREIYPNIYSQASNEASRSLAQLIKPESTAASRALSAAALALAAHQIVTIETIFRAMENRKIDLLECDEDGKPLFETEQELFRLLGAIPGVTVPKVASEAVIYDVADMLRARWFARQEFTNCPTELFPFELLPAPYDWRLDLEDTTQKLFETLANQRNGLTKDGDTDDRVAIAGHSTGGVIIRRLCTYDGAKDLVDKAFFMNVPFRGAPKALSVFLFGGDPPTIGRFHPMMPKPLLDPDSMVHLAPNLPIVYYLAPSLSYPDPVCVVNPPESAGGAGHNRESEKQAVVTIARVMKLYHPIRPVKAGLPALDKMATALGAREWHDTWWDCNRRVAYGQFWEEEDLLHFNKKKFRATENLELQDRMREGYVVGWNAKIAQNAKEFHNLSEMKIGETPIDLFVFWSEGTATLGAVNFKLPPYDNDRDVMFQKWCQRPWGEPLEWEDVGLPAASYFTDGKYPAVTISDSFDFKFERWDYVKGKKWKFFWSITAALVDGDGTVPRASLLGIGAPQAKIFKAIPGNPGHVPAPNNEFVWDRVIDVLIGRDISVHLSSEPGISPTNPKNVPFRETAPTPD